MKEGISLFLSAIRVQWWPEFLGSLKDCKTPIEVIFCGNVKPDFKLPDYAKFIYSDSTPAICYEIARRACTKELVHWTCDDAVYSEGFLDKAYDYWKSKNNEKLVLSLQTKENGHMCIMDTHRFFNGFNDKPLMAPLGVMSRDYLNSLGGIDGRYKYEQYENDIVMRVYEDGGELELFLHNGYVDIDHKRKHGTQHITSEQYSIDRDVLEGSWSKDGVVSFERNDQFIPFPSNLK